MSVESRRDRSRPLPLPIAGRLLVAALSMLATACGGGAATAPPPDELVVEHDTRDGVPVVQNVSGRAWRAPARLVQEVVIGGGGEVEDEYVLGFVPAAASTEDRIFALDASIPAVRVYDMSGTYLHDIGRSGEGPGEYSRANGLALDPEGRVLVSEVGRHQVLVYTQDGEHIDTWEWNHSGVSAGPRMLLAAPGGDAWVHTFTMPESGDFSSSRDGYLRLGPEGPAESPTLMPDPPGFEPLVVTVPTQYGDQSYDWIVPFAPNAIRVMDGAGNWYVGTGADYRIWIFGPDGGRRILERYWEPEPVLPGEAADHLRKVEADLRRMERVPAWSWTGPDVPAHKPAFDWLVPDLSGRLWVERQGEGRRIPDCDLEETLEVRGEPPCWTAERFWDLFELADGRYLGAVSVPDEVVGLSRASIDGDRILVLRRDEIGDTQLALYRLDVGPGES